MEKIKINMKLSEQKVRLPKTLGFGNIFTDHIFEISHDENKGWHSPEIKPLDSLTLHPASMFIHYGQAIFEGMKAFKTIDDEVVLFRPEEHFKRLNRSAARLCMPEIDVIFLTEALRELVRIEKDWIPTGEGEALYIRPFMFGDEAALGVRPSKSYKLIIMLSPVGAYYSSGFTPVKILVQDEFVRTIRKGTGECKTPGNYAASLLATEHAKKLGYTQVLWLDGVEQKNIEEVGTMNIFVTFHDEVVTPKLTGGILPGITRASVLQLLNDWGMKHSERLVSLDELISRYKKGEVRGVFGTGTAAIISSVGELRYKDQTMIINNGQPGEVASKLFKTLTSIHKGIIPDQHNWLTKIVEEVIA